MSDVSAPPENIKVDTVRTDDEALTTDTSQITRDINTIESSTTIHVSYMNILIDKDIFHERIQDIGCTEKELSKKRYRQAKILSVGPEGKEVFFYDLTSIAVDYVKKMYAMCNEESAWKNLPKNLPNVKAKIVQTC